MIQNSGDFVKTVAVHYVHHKHRPVRWVELLNQRQNLFRSNLIDDIIINGYLLARFQRTVLILLMIFTVMTNGRIDQNRSQPGFERQRLVVTV